MKNTSIVLLRGLEVIFAFSSTFLKWMNFLSLSLHSFHSSFFMSNPIVFCKFTLHKTKFLTLSRVRNFPKNLLVEFGLFGVWFLYLKIPCLKTDFLLDDVRCCC